MPAADAAGSSRTPRRSYHASRELASASALSLDAASAAALASASAFSLAVSLKSFEGVDNRPWKASIPASMPASIVPIAFSALLRGLKDVFGSGVLGSAALGVGVGVGGGAAAGAAATAA